ncbi:hypothetical protein NL50_11500 [Clostridium acetobutylicum]|nr:hypothetical protein NL50_11500 [Clostridium acetobutylicum]
MKFKKGIIIIFTFLIIGMLSACDNKKSSMLQLNLKEGDKYRLHCINDSKFSIKVIQKNSSVEDKEDMYIDMDVDSVDKDQNVTFSYKYNSINSHFTTSKGTIDYNSKNGDNGPVDKIYKNIMAKKYTVKLNKNGKVLSIHGAGSLVDAVDNDVSLDQNMKNVLRDNLEDNFKDESMKVYIEDAMNYTNASSVKKGDSWQRKLKTNKEFSMDITSKYTLKKEHEKSLDIEENDNIVANDKGKQIDFGGTKAKVDLNGRANGNINVDKKTGLINRGEVKYDVNGAVTCLKNEDIGIINDITSPVSFTQDITYEIVPR